MDFSSITIFCKRTLILSCLAIAGCGSSTDNATAKKNDGSEAQKVEVQKPVVNEQQPAAPATASAPTVVANAKMPTIFLSDTHAKTLKVKVGDAFPNFKLADASNKQQSLDELRGKRATLVFFWQMSEPLAREQFRDMQDQILKAYGSIGVNVVAINSAEAPATTKPLVDSVKPTFPVLYDANGEFFKQVGAGSLPRTFLIDPQGKILWLDIEYSRTTRRQMQEAIQSMIKEI